MKISSCRFPRRLTRCSFACCLFACSTFFAAAVVQAQRLPNTVRPEHYSLTLTPDLKAATFTGSETIDITLAEPTSQHHPERPRPRPSSP